MTAKTKLAILATFVLFGVVPSSTGVEGPANQDTPETTVDAFHQALKVGDRDAALALLAPEVVIFESGGAEMSRTEYASHHLGGDMKFSAAVDTEVVDRQSGSDGKSAWVLTRSQTRGTYGDREINAKGTETMILVNIDGSWRIVHIHWSSRSK